jgi:phosphoglycolate phosphatase
MIHSFKHVIWDWNGTLLDDTQAGVNAVNAMLSARNLPTLDVPSYREVFGFPVRDFYRAVGFCLEAEDWDAMAREFHDQFLADTSLCLHADAARALACFAAAGIGQSVLSASEQTILDAMLADFGVARFFANVCGVDNLYGHSKLALGRGLLDRLGLPPERVLLIGDSLHDHEVAAALNVPCLLIAQGHQSYARLVRSGAPVLESLADLPGWLSPER